MFVENGGAFSSGECPAAVKAALQRRGMFPLVAAVGMTRTASARHGADGAESRPAVLARIAVFLTPLVEFVLALVASRRMARTTRPRQRIHRRRPGPAMFAIEVCHFPFPFLLVVWIACSTVERRGTFLLSKSRAKPVREEKTSRFFALVFRKRPQ